jgi:hypothetical protein
MSMGTATTTADEKEPGVYSAGFIPSMDYRITVAVEGPLGKSEKTLDAEAW